MEQDRNLSKKVALAAEEFGKEGEYWLNKFSGDPKKSSFPYNRHHTGLKQEKAEYNSVKFEFNTDVYSRLLELSKKLDHRLYMILTAVLTVLLHKYTGSSDIIIGSPILKQEREENFINTVLALRNQLHENMTFKQLLLDQVRPTILEASQHQNYPIETLLFQLNIPYLEQEFPLFDVILLLENIHEKKYIQHTHPNIIFSFLRTGETLQGTVGYKASRYNQPAIEGIVRHFKALTTEVIFNVDIPVHAIDMLEEEEKRQLLVEFNNTRTPYPADKTIDELFAEQAARVPGKIALTYEGVPLAYKELKEKVDSLAFYLHGLGVRTGEPVALMAENSHKVIIAILAILQAGGAYLPLNTEYPGKRKKYILKDCNANILLTNLPGSYQNLKQVIDLDDNRIYKDRGNFTRRHTSNSLAYIMYTSGSTGTPKGVLIEHKSVVRLVKNTNYICFKNDDSILLTGALEFDASTFEIWGALLNGLSLHLVSKDTILNPARLKQATRKQAITTMWMTSPFFNQMVDADIEIFYGLKHLLVGGDVLSPSHINRLREHFPGLTVINGYGPTENTTFSITFRIDRKYKNNIPIGKPISNSTAYILDRHYQPVPIGVTGELHVGGDGLARGYLNNPELTAEKFLGTNQKFFGGSRGAIFQKSPPGRRRQKIYKTGDLARWLADGNIEFSGRIDHQVKIRGYRIEPGEIENHLTRIPFIKEAVVIHLENKDKEKFLCAYIVPQNTGKEKSAGLDIAGIKKILSAQLPDYMLPAYFVLLAEIPLTPNGKVDRKALPTPETTGGAIYTAPRNPVEEKFVEIWSEVIKLDKDRIGVDSDFFDLGGHSLKAAILIAKLHKAFNIKIPLAEFFRTPTIRELAEHVIYVKGEEEEAFLSIEKTEEKEYYELSSAQKRMYILQQLELGGINYNVPAVVCLEGELDRNKLELSLQRLIKRHESLRTSFQIIAGEPIQQIHDLVEFEIKYYNSGRQGDRERGNELTKAFIRPFDLSKAPLLRVGLLPAPCPLLPASSILIVDMHHIITDGTSLDIFVKELMALYKGEELPSLKLQYKDFAAWQNSRQEKKRIKHQEEYWIKEFAGEIPILNLPLDYTRPKIQNFAGNLMSFEISARQTKLLRELVSRQGTTLFMALFAVTNILLAKLSNQQDIVIGTPVAARRHVDLEKIIGMFVNTLALRNDPSPRKTGLEFLKEVTNKTLTAFENQEYQFEDLVEQLSGKMNRDTSRNPLFDVMFTLFNVETPEIQIPGLKLKPYDYEYNVSKFDLTLRAEEKEENLFLTFEYCTKLFKQETIQRFTGYFKKILLSLLENPGKQILEIEIITQEEKQKILFDFNDTAKEYPADKTIHQLFEKQVEKTPDQIALVGVHETHEKNKKNYNMSYISHMSYQELNKKAHQLAYLLKERGVGPDIIVALMLERSIEMIVGILGILKAGGAYLPIDPDYPEERIKYMLKDSNTKILLTREEIAGLSSPEALNIRPKGTSFHLHLSPAPVTCLAYIIYTSGSTGKPKGVMIQHPGLVNYIWSAAKNFVKDEKVNFPLYTSISFDLTITSIFTPLITGNRIVIYSDREKALLIEEVVEDSHIDIIKTTPAHLKIIREKKIENHTGSIKRFIVGGEALDSSLAGDTYHNFKGAAEIYNEYGPTEATVGCMLYQYSNSEDYHGSVPIGKPIANIRTYILSSTRHLQPVGIPGELCIGGQGLARGYLNNPELTAERFFPVSNRFYRSYLSYRSYSSKKIYKTGDLARWLVDGNIEFLGRIDQQLKIRGFRIEPGEIENQLSQYKEIKEVIVIDKEKQSGEKYLCAYFTAATNLEAYQLKEHLAHRLPDYMIPSYFIQIDKLPLTPNGKVNPKELPEPELKTTSVYTAPRNETEKKLVNIWSEILIRDALPVSPNQDHISIGIDDNFFELGGNSLDIIKISHRLKTEFAVDITVVTLFRYPTIRATAAYLNQEAEDFSQKKQEIFHALDKGKHKLKKRIEKRNKKCLK